MDKFYCAGKTLAGGSCGMAVKNDGDYCHIHQDQDTRNQTAATDEGAAAKVEQRGPAEQRAYEERMAEFLLASKPVKDEDGNVVKPGHWVMYKYINQDKNSPRYGESSDQYLQVISCPPTNAGEIMVLGMTKSRSDNDDGERRHYLRAISNLKLGPAVTDEDNLIKPELPDGSVRLFGVHKSKRFKLHQAKNAKDAAAAIGTGAWALLDDPVALDQILTVDVFIPPFTPDDVVATFEG